MKVHGKTGGIIGAEKMLYSNNRIKLITRTDQILQADLPGTFENSQSFHLEIPFSSFHSSSSCVSQSDIKQVHLTAASIDGWFIESIYVSIKTAESSYQILTSNPNLNKWIDADEDPAGRDVPLSLAHSSRNCITKLKVDGLTANAATVSTSGHDYSYGNNQIRLALRNGRQLNAYFYGSMEPGQRYVTELDFSSSFETTECIKCQDIEEVHLVAKSSDGWLIASISTSIMIGSEPYRLLTDNPNFNKWVDADEAVEARNVKLSDIMCTIHDQQDLHLSSGNTDPVRDVVECGFHNPVCKCNKDADECEFDFEVDELRTFTRYPTYPSSKVRAPHEVLVYIDDDGSVKALDPRDDNNCANLSSTDCTEPQFVDGTSYRLALSVNGRIPGPTIIVHEGQTVIVNVANRLLSESISIHWHGMYQKGTPWMDGVGQLTQCQILPSTTFRYIYKANPAGTHWYHSHTGAQRTDGLFGALVVLESDERMNNTKAELNHKLKHFLDVPEEHTLTLIDWQQESTSRTFSGFASYKNLHSTEIPITCSKKHKPTHSYDSGGVTSSTPFFSALINGKGRHSKLPYSKTRLSVFTVEQNKKYRFRLVGAQGEVAFKFSIDGHKLCVVGTDGKWIKPVHEVDYIILHSGERYDFILEGPPPNVGNGRVYWMRAETLEVNIPKVGNVVPPPYKSLGNMAEGILYYQPKGNETIDFIKDNTIPSTAYEYFEAESPPIKCTANSSCKAVNCPFENFHPSYHIDCVNVNELELLFPTPSNEMPSKDEIYENTTIFFNFNFEGYKGSSSVNGRNFILPNYAPQLKPNSTHVNKTYCVSDDLDCNPSDLNCRCTYLKDLEHNKTAQLIFSSLGKNDKAHPIHLHGHAFHIAHIGYPKYDKFGFISNHNKDIYCNDTHCTKPDCEMNKCTNPSWSENFMPDFSVNDTTVRKDTVIVPAGGYVVIQFKTDNPGYWILHCHIEKHQLDGMAVVINEAQNLHPRPPEKMHMCGNFIAEPNDVLNRAAKNT